MDNKKVARMSVSIKIEKIMLSENLQKNQSQSIMLTTQFFENF